MYFLLEVSPSQASDLAHDLLHGLQILWIVRSKVLSEFLENSWHRRFMTDIAASSRMLSQIIHFRFKEAAQKIPMMTFESKIGIIEKNLAKKVW